MCSIRIAGCARNLDSTSPICRSAPIRAHLVQARYSKLTTILGLVSDREALLAGRDTLAGTATLNWSADIPITRWDGVKVEGTPQRVASLDLSWRGLTGSIPRELGGLSILRELRLSNNMLDGEIPSELGNLSNLETLQLDENELSGEIPAKLGRPPN